MRQGTLEQVELDFDATGERRERNTLINDIRRDVARWRRGGEYAGVTPITCKLLQHWADEELTGEDADIIEALNLDEEGKSTREEIEESLLTNVRNRVREAGVALRVNNLPRLPSSCSHCDWPRCAGSGPTPRAP